MADPLNVCVESLKATWDTNNRTPKPQIAAIIDYPGKLDYVKSAYVLLYETAWDREREDATYTIETKRIIISIDIRTKKSREDLTDLFDEVERIVNEKRMSLGSGFDRWNILRRVDLSDKTSKFYRYVLDTELEALYTTITT